MHDEPIKFIKIMLRSGICQCCFWIFKLLYLDFQILFFKRKKLSKLLLSKSIFIANNVHFYFIDFQHILFVLSKNIYSFCVCLHETLKCFSNGKKIDGLETVEERWFTNVIVDARLTNLATRLASTFSPIKVTCRDGTGMRVGQVELGFARPKPDLPNFFEP